MQRIKSLLNSRLAFVLKDSPLVPRYRNYRSERRDPPPTLDPFSIQRQPTSSRNNQPITPQSRRRALRESQGKVYRKL